MSAFAIDTGDAVSLGPWFYWSSNGSAEKSIPPRSWVLRGTDEDGTKFERVIPGFTSGCVLDLESLKLGWERNNGRAMAPSRVWSPSIDKAIPRPDDTKQGLSYAWSRALSVRCAIGGGQAATWEQGSFGAYEAFSRLAKLITAQYPGDMTLPLVKQSGTDKRDLPNGPANIPILEIVKWVPRPDCLKAAAPAIDTGASDFDHPAPASNPAPAAKPTATPAPAAKAPEPATTADDEF